VIEITHIDPCWNIDEFKELQYKKASYKGSELLESYINVGHTVSSMELYNYFEPNPMPECIENYIKPKFNFLKNIGIAVNLFKVGQFIPQHSDRYDRFKEVHNLSSIDSIVRYVVMLEDGLPGQILEIDNKCFSMWKAGDCFSWKNITLHAFYNFSKADRYALQITGVLK
jgi:hypothetical protein